MTYLWGNIRGFSTVESDDANVPQVSGWNPQEMWKTPPLSLSRQIDFLLLMLVVISLTFSAKAGSERIFFST